MAAHDDGKNSFNGLENIERRDARRRFSGGVAGVSKGIRNAGNYAWSSAAVIVIISTLLPLVRRDDWWIRWFDFPRLQLLVIGSALICVRLVARGLQMKGYRAVLFLALVVSVGYQAYRISPYTPMAGLQVKSADSSENDVVVRLVTVNVLMHNRAADRLLKVLADADPDMILTTEIDQWWSNRLKALDLSYPYHVKHPQENTYGMMLHSKHALVDPSVRFLVEPGVPSIHSGVRLPDGRQFYVIGLHPRPPGPTKSPDTTERDAELILAAKAVERSDPAVVILGDLNDVAWSDTTRLFQKISGLLDPRIGRGMFNTFHADYFFIRFPLDHVFHSAHFQLIDMRRLPHIGSDHFPIYTALSFNPQPDAAERPSAPKQGEKKEARETVEKALKTTP